MPVFEITDAEHTVFTGYESSGFMGFDTAWNLKQLGLIDTAAVSVNLKENHTHYVKFGKSDRVGVVGEDFKMLSSDQKFRVAAKDFTWGNTGLSFDSTLMQINLDSPFTYLPISDFAKLLPHLENMSGVNCASGLCYYSSDCSPIDISQTFGFRAFAGDTSIPV